jgi:hypothetical protein
MSYQFFLDGNEIPDLAVSGNAGTLFGSSTVISVGFRNYQNVSNGSEVYIDDLAIDPARIGCN